ncbi:cation-translocating P-type ATPase [Parvimonas micra]|uniref:heavy metal translocating P-type ATPase n=1 Tax=Parvimonas micra TaxID=33033 RepID=UPI0022B6E6D9|nr:cation-translocating P-type ATPase [Parvimonas micra]WBB32289.1 cation-translocating P-type ATPase [Parvimonas micra]WBB33797.1 cation-translocating P-type ATPase [Parvimonas micra]WBB35318.1 cation-translocating P-type ATPase [Parvimonas micra]
MINKMKELFSGLHFTIISIAFFVLNVVLNLLKIETVFKPVWISIFISSFPFLVGAVKNLMKCKIKNSLLISIAVIASVFVGEYFAAAEIAILMAIGELLEDYTVDRAKKGLNDLISSAPKKAKKLIKTNDSYTVKEVPIEEIENGDLIRVMPGEIISVDGIIKEGFSSIDQSILTGESLPVDKTVGDEVFCGSMNCFGSIDIIAKDVENSSLQKFIDLVERAEKEQTPMQTVIDRLAVKLVPTALLIAIATFVIMVLSKFDLYTSINRAVTVLVVFCPCALFLSTPTAVMASIGQASKHGVIIKTFNALEKLAKVNKIAFDKTGTLTYGKLNVNDIENFSDLSDEKIMSLISSLESKSEHPIAKSVTEYLDEKNIKKEVVENFKMKIARGVEGDILGNKYFCGNEKYFKENNINIKENVKEKIEKYSSEAKNIILFGDEKEVLSIVTLSDTLRENAKEMVENLKNFEIEPLLLTGDNLSTAKYFSEKVGITNVKAELSPEEKFENIKSLKENNVVCMIGDGINDAPALKLSDVSVAMGKTGSDISIESANIVLMGHDVSKIVYLKKLANATVKTIKFNIVASLLINFVAVILSVLGVLNPLVGAIVHNLGSILVILNASLLYDRKFN